MGRLADLAAASPAALTLAAAASRLGVQPLLLARVDQGLQPMPARLAGGLASLLGVAPWAVRAACRLNTDLDDPVLYNAIPPRLGEPVGGAVQSA